MSDIELLEHYKKLPENLKMEVEKYIYQLEKSDSKKNQNKTFKFDWEGGLSDLENISSVELQHLISYFH